MSSFNDEDSKTLKALGLTMGGFFALTVVLILGAQFLT